MKWKTFDSQLDFWPYLFFSSQDWRWSCCLMPCMLVFRLRSTHWAFSSKMCALLRVEFRIYPSNTDLCCRLLLRMGPVVILELIVVLQWMTLLVLHVLRSFMRTCIHFPWPFLALVYCIFISFSSVLFVSSYSFFNEFVTPFLYYYDIMALFSKSKQKRDWDAYNWCTQ